MTNQTSTRADDFRASIERLVKHWHGPMHGINSAAMRGVLVEIAAGLSDDEPRMPRPTVKFER